MIKDRNERINFMMCYDDRNKYRPLVQECPVREKSFDFFRYTKMAEQHYQRAEAIFAGNIPQPWGDYNYGCYELEASWYYLLYAAECGELEFVSNEGEQE